MGPLSGRLIPTAIGHALLLVVLFSPGLAAQDFTIEEVLSAPMPSNLVAAPVGSAVAWVQTERGIRNIFVAEAPGFQGRQLTSYTEDDGHGLGSLQFTKDGEAILYTRGGGPNRQGQFPNPRSFTESLPPTSYIVPLAGGEPRKLPARGSPVLSPDGETAIYSQGGAVYRIALTAAESEAGEEEPGAEDTGAEADGASPEKLFEVRNGAGSLTFSPDGAKIAFVSGRGDHSFVGVWAEGETAVRWMSPALWSDTNPVWSPDGQRLAFVRSMNVPGFWPFMPLPETVPFSIRVADVSDGTSREVFRADKGPGSAFHRWNAGQQIYWGEGDHLVFPWEKNGWLNLWSVPAAGGRAVALTPGEFEVQFGTITPDRTAIVYDSNQDDIDRKHLWRVPVDGSEAPHRITWGTGIEWSPVPTPAGDLAFFASDGTTPAHAEIMAGDAGRRALVADWLPDEFPRRDLVQPEPVVFSASDGVMIHGQLFLPSDLDAGDRRPAVIFLHGGSRRQMLLGFHHSGYYHNAYALSQYFASQGYVALSVNYRSGIGYGLAFREAEDYGATGASEVRDVLGAGAYLRTRTDVDPDRIGLWGGSYGGYLTAHGLAQASDLFAAGVDIHGVHDWNVVINGFRPDYDKGQWDEFSTLAFESSPLHYIEGWESPVLLIHGDDDRNVPFSESVDLAYHLLRRGVYFEELVFPDEVHGFLLHRNWVAAYEATADFFERMLMEGGAATHRRR